MTHPIRRSMLRRGFTIVEVMIVLAIILFLATLVAVNVTGNKKEAQIDTAKVSMRSLEKALMSFQRKFDRYPTDEEGLSVLWDKSKLTTEDESQAAKWERFVDRGDDAEKDPWGTPWGYTQKDEGSDDDIFDLWSYGPDKLDGTDDDIHNRAKAADAGASPSTSGSTK